MVGDILALLTSWLPSWFVMVVLTAFAALVIVGLIRLIIWIIEIIPGF